MKENRVEVQLCVTGEIKVKETFFFRYQVCTQKISLKNRCQQNDDTFPFRFQKHQVLFKEH